jgi:hypothetical protein
MADLRGPCGSGQQCESNAIRKLLTYNENLYEFAVLSWGGTSETPQVVATSSLVKALFGPGILIDIDSEFRSLSF